MSEERRYIGGARASGRTHNALMKIKDDPNAIFIVMSEDQAQQLRSKYKPKCQIIANPHPDKLRGLHPDRIVRDHFFIERQMDIIRQEVIKEWEKEK